MQEITYFQVGKSWILQRQHENVGVACLSSEELHTPLGSLQDKLLLLKKFKWQKENIKKTSENYQKI